jgi:putative peptidoglycan lipid II flippase
VLSILRMVAFVTVPAAVGLIVLASPIVQVCFERGAFDRYSTVMTAQTLSLFAVGLLAYAAGKVLSSSFYALHDTRTPVRLAIEALLVNVALALGFVGPLGVKGLALATALASSLNAWRLLRTLERRLGAPLAPSLMRSLGRLGVAALITAVGCWAAWEGCAQVMRPVAALPVVIVGTMIVYGVSCRVAGVEELPSALRWLARSFRIQHSPSA